MTISNTKPTTYASNTNNASVINANNINTNNAIRVFLFGYSGNMGLALSRLAKNHGLIIYGGINKSGVHIIDTAIDNVNCTKNIFTYDISQLYAVVDGNDFDVVVDFSNQSIIDVVLKFTTFYKKPLLIASTGHTSTQLKQIKKASNLNPIILAPNLSLGINSILQIIESLCTSIQECDISIIEKHHNKKLDKPSGTAKLIVGCIKKTTTANATIHSVRGGNCSGTHEISFYFGDELITISHTAQSRTPYALGAVTAIKWLYNCTKPALYSMHDCM